MLLLSLLCAAAIMAVNPALSAPATTAIPHHNGAHVDGQLCRMRAVDVKGKPIVYTDMHSERVYSFECDAPAAATGRPHCLLLGNCTVALADQRGGRVPPMGAMGAAPVPVIDERGCSLEPQLFEDVEYTSDLSATIYNPVPVQLSESLYAGVRLSCSTVLRSVDAAAGSCDRWRRARCIRSEYAQHLQWPVGAGSSR